MQSRRVDGDARGRTRVLLTGFGPFPGVPVNASMGLVPELRERAAAMFPDVRIVAAILPTEWQAAPGRLDQVLTEVAPDLVLHFGVSSRARGFEIEARACNHCAATPDASGALPDAGAIHSDGAEHMRASLPVQHIVARLRRLRIAAFVSRDAGAYLCNATLYHSLLRARETPGRRVGFIHIPASLAQPGAPSRGRVGACPLTWELAVEGGLEILACSLARARVMPSKAHRALAAIMR
jgi:pyroglutamyl-peptidase